jgi:hypothetical protein
MVLQVAEIGLRLWYPVEIDQTIPKPMFQRWGGTWPFADTRGDGEVAPVSAVHGTPLEPQGLTR